MTEHNNARMAVVALKAILQCDDAEDAREIARATLVAFREKELPSSIDLGDEEDTHP